MFLKIFAGFNPAQEFPLNVAIICGTIGGLVAMLVPLFLLKKLRDKGLIQRSVIIGSAMIVLIIVLVLAALLIMLNFGPADT